MQIDKEAFNLGTLEDELRVDRLCLELLQEFHRQLQADGVAPLEAGGLAHGADYFIRDFLVAVKQRNIFAEEPGLVRQFAGNWYIVNTMEPDIKELAGHLEGIGAFYRFLQRRQLISAGYLQGVEQECAAIPYYADRIEAFWAIKGDGYYTWERECSLKETGKGD